MAHAIGFRELVRSDLAMLAGWLSQPHVAQWWREPSDLASVEARYLPCIDGRDPAELFVIEVDAAAAGFIQRYLITTDEEWIGVLAKTGTTGWEKAAGIDYLIGDPGLTGKGIGAAAITQFAALTFERWPQADGIVVDVQQDNAASWRALEKAGFTRLWAGQLHCADPSDAAPSYLYRLPRPA